MKVKIIQQQYNLLLKRKEVTFEVDHSQIRGTPKRLEIREALAKILKVNQGSVFIKRVKTRTGTMIAIGEANAYDSTELAKLSESTHIIARNALPTENAETIEKSELSKKA